MGPMGWLSAPDSDLGWKKSQPASQPASQWSVETAPLVVSTHGGPASANVFKWVTESEYIPQLCALGYFVLHGRGQPARMRDYSSSHDEIRLHTSEHIYYAHAC